MTSSDHGDDRQKAPDAIGGHCPPALTDQEFQLFRDILYRQSGIALRPSKKILIQNRLRGRLGALGIGSWGDYYAYLSSHPSEIPLFLDALTTHETYFMREESHWTFLRETLLPQLVSRNAGATRNLAVWSAAASSGEELYSAAIVLAENLAGFSGWQLRLVGTDVSTSVIRRAREGIYNDYALHSLEPALRQKYFTPTRDAYGQQAWRISPWLRELCRFEIHNLQHPFTEHGFDLILCRNVFIYFDRAAKQRALNLLLPALAPGGTICFSHTDMPIPETGRLLRVQPSVYQKIAE